MENHNIHNILFCFHLCILIGPYCLSRSATSYFPSSTGCIKAAERTEKYQNKHAGH